MGGNSSLEMEKILKLWTFPAFQFEFRASSAAAIDAAGKEKEEQLAKLTGGKVKDVSNETDVNVLKNLVSEFTFNDTLLLQRHSSEPSKDSPGLQTATKMAAK